MTKFEQGMNNFHAEVNLGGCSVINIKTKNTSYFLHYSSGEIDDYLMNGKPGGEKIKLMTVTETGSGFLKKKNFIEYQPKTESKLRRDIEKLTKELSKEQRGLHCNINYNSRVKICT